MQTDQTDIHGTNWVESVAIGPEPSQHVVVNLNFRPTDEQLRSLFEHLQSWHP